MHENSMEIIYSKNLMDTRIEQLTLELITARNNWLASFRIRFNFYPMLYTILVKEPITALKWCGKQLFCIETLWLWKFNRIAASVAVRKLTFSH